MIQSCTFWVGFVFLLSPFTVTSYSRPLRYIMHRPFVVKECNRVDLRFGALQSSDVVTETDSIQTENAEIEVGILSPYELARNERLLADMDPQVKIVRKQARKRHGGYEAVRKALLAYQKINGDMLVPSGFIVPEKGRKWPKVTWGMNLGIVTKNIRGGLNHKEKREELEAMGFCFSPLQAKFNLVKLSLSTYLTLHGDMIVPQKFIIPNDNVEWPEECWGFPLGSLVSNIRSGSSFADKREELLSIGFPFNSRMGRYDLIKLAILKFKEINGHTLVPQTFVIPKNSKMYPKGLLGIRLGSIVHGIRGGSRYTKKKEDLLSIGFDYGSQKAVYGYNLTKEALLHYKNISEKGDMRVPYNFIVPENDEKWPAEFWGMNLGMLVNNIKGGNYADKREELISIGFCYFPFKSRYIKVRNALLNYKEIHGDILVSRQYVVPFDDDRWPKKSWGMKLGTVVYNIRSGSSFADQRADLISIGFRFDAIQARYDILKNALLTYKEMYGDMLVPKGFEVPEDSPDWPAELWGMKLGAAVRNMRSDKGSYIDKKDELISMGFVFRLHKRFDYECVKIAVYKYRELYHGSVIIPQVYNIPKNDPWYPEETWGMCLGSIVTRIKQGEKWPEKRFELLGE